MISLITSLKTKIYGFFALLFIALGAFAKWQYASNKEKSKKIKDLKNEVKIAKKIAKSKSNIAEYYGYQDAINVLNRSYEKRTQKADKNRGDIDEANPNYTTVNI